VTVRRLTIRAEFHTSGLWSSEPALLGDVEFEELGHAVSPALVARFEQWRDRWDAIFDDDYPPDSSFRSAADEQRFIADGARLRDELAAELGPGWDVSYEPVTPML
jgi:hypothetical protein